MCQKRKQGFTAILGGWGPSFKKQASVTLGFFKTFYPTLVQSDNNLEQYFYQNVDTLYSSNVQ